MLLDQRPAELPAANSAGLHFLPLDRLISRNVGRVVLLAAIGVEVLVAGRSLPLQMLVRGLLVEVHKKSRRRIFQDRVVLEGGIVIAMRIRTRLIIVIAATSIRSKIRH